MAKILLVDDCETSRQFLAGVIGQLGHETGHATNGMEALERVRASRPDLVITDIMLPVMDGYEFVRQVRMDPSLPEIQVVFCTAFYLEREARSLAGSCGVNWILLKPVEPEEVIRTIQTALTPKMELLPAPESDHDNEDTGPLTVKLTQSKDDIRVLNSRLEALLSLTHEWASEHDSANLLKRCCEVARRMAGARVAAIRLLQGDDDFPSRHLVTSGSGRREAWMAGDGLPDEVLRAVVDERRTVRWAGPGRGGVERSSNLVVPVTSGKRVLGWLLVHDRIGAEKFEEPEERVTRSLAAQLAVFYENALLYERNVRHAKDLSQLVEEKDVLLREIHHRVKNNLQVVSSLLSLQSEKIQDESVRELLLDSQNRVQSMALIHEQLYRSPELANVEFAEYAETLVRNLMDCYAGPARSISAEIKVDMALALALDQAIPCGLIVHELFSNSLKHAFPGNRCGKVVLNFSREGDLCRLEVSDDGVGMQPGVDFSSSETLGLKVVGILAKQLDCTIERQPGPGTSFELKFRPARAKSASVGTR